MTLVRTSVTAALQYALGLQGRSRTAGNAPWTPDRTIDDCARFCSHVLWGGDPGPISWVDNFKTAHDGTYRRGKAGMAPGDVVLFDWDGNGVGNHVEMCLTAPNSRGVFTTIGANGSDTPAAKVRTRSAYVLGTFRPGWTANSATPANPDPSTTESSLMTARSYRNTASGAIDSIDPTGIHAWHLPNTDYVNLAVATGMVPNATPIDVPDNVFQFLYQMRNANVDAIADAVWNYPIDGWNGRQLAKARMEGSDHKAGTAVATIDDAAATTIATKLFAAIKTVFNK